MGQSKLDALTKAAEKVVDYAIHSDLCLCEELHEMCPFCKLEEALKTKDGDTMTDIKLTPWRDIYTAGDMVRVMYCQDLITMTKVWGTPEQRSQIDNTVEKAVVDRFNRDLECGARIDWSQ